MDRVAPGLYVGSLDDAADGPALREAGIETVVCLTHDPPEGGYPGSVSAHAYPMLDGPRNDPDAFDAAAESLRELLGAGETVLVHCSAGASRSVSVAAAALAVSEGVGIREAFERVGDARAVADPHPALIRRAAAFVAERSE